MMLRPLLVERHVEGKHLGLESCPLIMDVQEPCRMCTTRNTFRRQARAILREEARLRARGIVLTGRRYRKFGEALVAQAKRFDNRSGPLRALCSMTEQCPPKPEVQLCRNLGHPTCYAKFCELLSLK